MVEMCVWLIRLAVGGIAKWVRGSNSNKTVSFHPSHIKGSEQKTHLLLDVIQRIGRVDGEADEDDVGVGVREGSETVVVCGDVVLVRQLHESRPNERETERDRERRGYGRKGRKEGVGEKNSPSPTPAPPR